MRYDGGVNTLTLIQKELAKVAISDLPAIAEKVDVPFGTLFKIKYGTTKNPRYETVEKLRAWALRERAA